nr:uncharacterized protein LOC127340151 [Lolium perenne]
MPRPGLHTPATAHQPRGQHRSRRRAALPPRALAVAAVATAIRSTSTTRGLAPAIRSRRHGQPGPDPARPPTTAGAPRPPAGKKEPPRPPSSHARSTPASSTARRRARRPSRARASSFSPGTREGKKAPRRHHPRPARGFAGPPPAAARQGREEVGGEWRRLGFAPRPPEEGDARGGSKSSEHVFL